MSKLGTDLYILFYVITLTPTNSGQVTSPWFGADASMTTEPNTTLPIDPALFSLYTDIMLGFPKIKICQHCGINMYDSLYYISE